MKYVVIVVIALLMARADLFLGIVDRFLVKSEPTPVEVDASEVKSNELVPIAKDASLKQTPRETFLALLEDFHANPIAPIHERAMAIFKDNPTIFNSKLDIQLESNVFRWRDLLNNNDPEAVKFMLDLLNILQGENLAMMKRFFALWMDIDMENFIAAYSKTKDSNCTIATTFGEPIPEEEKINEYVEREDFLKALVAKDKIDPIQKNLANNCILVLQIEIAKAPKPAPEESTPPEEGDSAVAPEPVIPVPVPPLTPAPTTAPTPAPNPALPLMPNQGGVTP